jgi:PEP-CTERM motif-containing protein
MRRLTMTAACIAALMMAGAAQATTAISWVGGGTLEAPVFWDFGANWSTEGGAAADAQATFGRTSGWENRNAGAPVSPDVVIDGPGSNVLYDSAFTGDFRFDQREDLGAGNNGNLTVSNGASLTWFSEDADEDGMWSQWDAGILTVTGEGSLMQRTRVGGSLTGGFMHFGSWRGHENQVMELNVLDHAKYISNGPIGNGAAGDTNPGLKVTTTIGTGATIELFNSDAANHDDSSCYPNGEPCQGDFNFDYGYNDDNSTFKGEDYKVNFTGHGGSLQVSKAGIWVQEETGVEDPEPGSPGDFINRYVATMVTYEQMYAGITTANPDDPGTDLATKQILQSNGSNAAIFGNVFSVTGTSGSDDYKVTSIMGAGLGGAYQSDIDGNLSVGSSDAGRLIAGFNTGSTLAEGDIDGNGVVDNADAGLLISDFNTQYDPGPANGNVGDAIAEYNTDTGRIIISVDQVQNWWIEGPMTGPDNPEAALLATGVGGLVGDAPDQIGHLVLGGNFSYTNVDMGLVAATGLSLDDLVLKYNGAVMGAPIDIGTITIVPEPVSFVLIGLGLCGVLASRRRLVA